MIRLLKHKLFGTEYIRCVHNGKFRTYKVQTQLKAGMLKDFPVYWVERYITRHDRPGRMVLNIDEYTLTDSWTGKKIGFEWVYMNQYQ